MDAYIAGAENLVDDRQRIGMRTGAGYRVPLSVAPWRFVFHKMEAPEDDPGSVPDEGWELDQSRAYIVRHEFPPHLWALPLNDWVGQTVPLTLAAYALKHDWSGYPETNHVHAIQVEVIGWSRDGLDDSDLCDWLGERVLGPVLDAGVPIDLGHLAPSDGYPDASGVNGSVRMSADAWYRFDGVCGHQNVPRNSHWDPGIADYARIARAARHQPIPAPSSEDDSMFFYDLNVNGVTRLVQVAGGKQTRVIGATYSKRCRESVFYLGLADDQQGDWYVKNYGPVVGL